VGPEEEAPPRVSRPAVGVHSIHVLVLVVGLAVAAIALFACSDGDSDLRLKPRAFPASDTKQSAVVWAVGDGADGGSDAAKVVRLIARDKPDRLLYLGDVYDDGTKEDFATGYEPSFGRLAKRTAPTPGNHDWPNRADGYRPYWKEVGGRSMPAYYSFSTAGWQFISLNSEAPHGAGSAQLEWVRTKLKGGGTCRIAFWHRPRYSAGDHHGDQPDLQPFWNALRGKAVLVLNGHEHDMQRFAPRDGITQLVSGAGGHSLYAVDTSYSGLVFGDSLNFGALRMTLTRGSASYKFVSSRGRMLDRGTTRCRPG
jgi:calcineurin-like phosphoesterase family protein